MKFIDTIYELFHELQYKFQEQLDAKSAFFYDYIITKNNSIDIFNYNGNISQQKQILLRTYDNDFNGYICITSNELLSFSKINYYTLIKTISDNFEILIVLLNLAEASQHFKENKFEHSVNEILLEYEIIDINMNEKMVEKVKNNFFKEFSKLATFHIFFYIPVEVISLKNKNKSPFFIDHFEHHKHKKYGYSDKQLFDRVINASTSYQNDICYINYFELFNSTVKFDYLMQQYCVNLVEDLYIDINIFKDKKININLFLNYVNKNYFDMIIEQQKFIFLQILLNANIENKDSHSSFEDLLIKNHKIKEKKYKKYKTFTKDEFEHKKDCIKQIIRLSNMAKNESKYAFNKISYIKKHLPKECQEEFNLYSELKLFKNANYYYLKILSRIPKNLQKKIEFKIYKNILTLIFKQYCIQRINSDDQIVFQKNIIYESVQENNINISEEEILNILDLVYLHQIKNLL